MSKDPGYQPRYTGATLSNRYLKENLNVIKNFNDTLKKNKKKNSVSKQINNEHHYKSKIIYY